MSGKRRKQNRGILRAIVGCLAGILVLTGGVLVYSGLIHRDGPDPGAVTGLEAEVCYHDISLTWEPVRKAAGYVIYAEEPGSAGEEPAFAQVGEVEDPKECTFQMEDYIHDEEYRLQVRAYGENWLTGNRREGEASETVTAIYDSSKYAQKIPVLTYHDLVPSGYEIVNGLTVQEDMFRDQMQYLKDEGFKTLTLDEFRQWYLGKLELPHKSCVVTFDDGAYEVYYLAYPILRENRQAATVFCIGHHLDEVGDQTAPYTPEDGIARRFGTDVIDKVRAEYPAFAFESHTYNMHKRIDGYKPVNKFTYEQMLEDAKENRKFDFSYLAYPWGATNKKMKKAVEEAGYKLAFGYEPFRYARRTDDPYRINRIKVSAYYSMDTFINMVNGTWEEEAE